MTKFTKLKKKVTKINANIISKAHTHLQIMEKKNMLKLSKGSVKTCMRSCAHEVSTVYVLRVKND